MRKESISSTSRAPRQEFSNRTNTKQNISIFAENTEKSSKIEFITAPLVGTYYSSPKPEDPPFVSVGDRVEVGQTICIIEAMKIFNDIDS